MKKWQVAIAIVVAFALGGAGGFLAEHQHLKDKSNQSASTPTTVARGKGVRWFAAPKAACPSLKAITTSGVAAYTAIVKKMPWTTISPALLAQQKGTTTALKALLPKATPQGKAALNRLILHSAQVTAAVPKATSQATFAVAAKALATPAVKRDTVILNRAIATCAKS